MNEQPRGIPAGIYFNMTKEQYHGDPALSHSGMTKLLVSWQDYWITSCLNPDRAKYLPTAAMQFGDRSHMLMLEPKLFAKKHSSSPASGGVYLSSIERQKLEDSVAAVKNVKVGADHFMHGYPEVAIFWRDPATGIMLRCMLDWLRTFGVIDFKRIKEVNNWGIGSAVKAQGLDIQNFLFLEGVKAAREMLRAMSAKQFIELAQRESVDKDWLREFMNEETLLFRFLFQRSTPPWIWEFRELENEVVTEGGNATHHAMVRYVAGLNKFGLKAPDMGTGEVKTVSQFHVPRRDYDYDR